MNIRLELFMQAEGLSAAKLSEILQVQPSSISHLLSGRNKPNFDFIARILRMFPDLNPDWIINGQGDMYRSKSTKPNLPNNDIKDVNYTTTKEDNIIDNKGNSLITNVTNGDLLTSPEVDPNRQSLDQTHKIIQSVNNENGRTEPTEQVEIKQPLEFKAVVEQSNQILSEPVDSNKKVNYNTNPSVVSSAPVSIEKVLVMYSDNTFEVFTEKSR